MKAQPHGIAIVIESESCLYGAETAKLFQQLQYQVRCCTTSQMMQLMEEIASINHTAFDSFVCCIISDTLSSDVYKLVDKIRQCDTLQEKPKLFFVMSAVMETTSRFRNRIGPDTLIMWCAQISNSSGKVSLSTIALNQVLKHQSKVSDLVSMTIDVSALISMFPAQYSKGSGIHTFAFTVKVIEQLTKKVYFHEVEIYGK